MTHRLTHIGIAGLLFGFIGVAARRWPVYLDQFDSYGIKIACGNGIVAAIGSADVADRGAVAAQCDTAVLVRRAWAVPAVVLGWLLITGAVLGWVRNAPPAADDDAPVPGPRPPHPEIA